ncbi:MAG: apolipoprotein N-acyltransferase, partial [Candidatus Binatia bacterium]
MTAPPQKTLARRLTAQTAATAATVASALLFIVAFPPLHLRALAWVALVPFLLAVRNASVPRAAALAALWGMIAAYGVTDWLPSTLVRYYGQPLWVGAAVFAG